jgi:hypothetical protein
MDQLCKELDAHFGCLPGALEDKFQKKCFEIQGVKSFYKYYPMVGIPIPDEEALRLRLVQAIENSRRKKYHGNDDNMNKIPKLEEQAKEYLEEKVKPFEFWNEASKEWLPAESDKWYKATIEKFSWIKSFITNSVAGEEPTPSDYALMSDEDNMNQRDFNAIKNKYDRLRTYITEKNAGGPHITSLDKTTIIDDYPATFGWRDLFLKLCFEQMLQYFPQHQDFKLFYKYID